jgi:hypothetical protein
LLKAIGELHRQGDAFAHLTRRFRGAAIDPAHEIQRFEKAVKMFGEQFLAKRRVPARAPQVVLAHKVPHPASLSKMARI